MAEEKKSVNLLSGLISLGFFIYLIYQFWGGGIENKVSNDSIEQYNIAKRQGDQTQICVQAGIVSASFLQSKDEENYKKWKAIEDQDCNYMH